MAKKRKTLEAQPQAPAVAPQTGSKLDALAALLAHPDGASVDEIMRATGWQAHSVRGAISGALKKRRGLEIAPEPVDGVRRYRIVWGGRGAGRISTDWRRCRCRSFARRGRQNGVFSCETFPVFEPEKSLLQVGMGRSAQHLNHGTISENCRNGEGFPAAANCAKFPDTAERPE